MVKGWRERGNKNEWQGGREGKRREMVSKVKAGLVQVGFRQSVCYFRRAEGGRAGERDGWREGKMNVVN